MNKAFINALEKNPSKRPGLVESTLTQRNDWTPSQHLLNHCCDIREIFGVFENWEVSRFGQGIELLLCLSLCFGIESHGKYERF
jgi:hypothetical protein